MAGEQELDNDTSGKIHQEIDKPAVCQSVRLKREIEYVARIIQFEDDSSLRDIKFSFKTVKKNRNLIQRQHPLQ